MSKAFEKSPTKERILEVAGHLFAEKGFDATSMRDITDAAGVNLASVNYHFGSKEGLISAVFGRLLVSVNKARLAMLDEIECVAEEGRPRLEAVLEAFVRPAVEQALDAARDNDSFIRLMGRCLTEPPAYFEKYVYPHFEKFILRFNAALRMAVPELTEEDAFWRGVLLAGSLHFALHAWCTNSLPLKPKRLPDAEELIRKVVTFAAAGIQSNHLRTVAEAPGQSDGRQAGPQG